MALLKLLHGFDKFVQYIVRPLPSKTKMFHVSPRFQCLLAAAAESTDFTWKSFVYDLRKGTLKFLANAHIDTLPTAANLKRWKKSSSDKCKLCKGRQTTAHCLNICKVAMETGIWTWRHNNVGNYVVQCLVPSKHTVISDIEGYEI